MWAAIQHFVPVLTRSGGAVRWLRAMPWLAIPLGAVLLVTLGGVLPRSVLLLPAGLLAAGAVVLAGWIWQRSRRALGAPHPGVRWYLAALLCLIAGLGAAAGMALDPARFPVWYRLHLHLNLLGWVGLTVLGTLPVLLPTCLQKFDPDAAFRLRLGLPWAVFGLLAICLGAALKLSALAALGAIALILLAGWHVQAWLTLYGAPWRWPGPAISLLIGLVFLIGLLALGVHHGAIGRGGQRLLPALVAGFLLPVVLGALAQLLPVWRFPGPDSVDRQTFARILARGASWRALLCLIGAFGVLYGQFQLLGLPALSLFWMLAATFRGLWATRAGSARRPTAL